MGGLERRCRGQDDNRSDVASLTSYTALFFPPLEASQNTRMRWTRGVSCCHAHFGCSRAKVVRQRETASGAHASTLGMFFRVTEKKSSGCSCYSCARCASNLYSYTPDKYLAIQIFVSNWSFKLIPGVSATALKTNRCGFQVYSYFW